MELLRKKIRAALDNSPGKSQKDLAKLLNVSPTQVSSLLKPHGRHLRAVEVPIVEHYLGITLLGASGDEIPPEADEPPAFLEAPGPPRPPGPTPEGTLVSVDDLRPELAHYLGMIAEECGGEVWRLTTNNVQAAGYFSGDYVVVGRGRRPRNKDVVLAELRNGVEPAVPIFRAYVPPYLMVANANPRAMLQTPLPVDDDRVAITGVIVASVRVRDDQFAGNARPNDA